MSKTSHIENLTKQQYLNHLNRLRGQITAVETEIVLLKSEYIGANSKLQKGQKVKVKCTEITAFNRRETLETATCTGEIRIDKEGDIWYEILFDDGYLTESRIQYLEVVE